MLNIYLMTLVWKYFWEKHRTLQSRVRVWGMYYVNECPHNREISVFVCVVVCYCQQLAICLVFPYTKPKASWTILKPNLPVDSHVNRYACFIHLAGQVACFSGSSALSGQSRWGFSWQVERLERLRFNVIFEGKLKNRWSVKRGHRLMFVEEHRQF